MNNEIGRKITSLTLMTIMIAGSMTFAFPGIMPEAHAQANANLFVSVEESFSPDRFGGAMVVEVVINDPDLKDTDETETEPDVTVNGKDLRMAQATDGNWYAYFTDLTMASNADRLSVANHTSLDFGEACTATSANTAGGVLFTDTEGVFFARDTNGGTNGGVAIGTCTGAGVAGTAANLLNNVIRENKTLTHAAAGGILAGQIGVTVKNWPFIQLFSFTAGGDAKVVYNIGGGSPQTVTIEFDDSLDDHATMTKDRTSYPQGADVHFTISDNWLNVDPTDEDSWTFGANVTNSSTVYQAYDENGALQSARVTQGTPDLQGNLTTLNAGDLGVLLINPNPNNALVDSIIDLFDNNDQNVTESALGPARVLAGGASGAGGISRFLGQNSAPVTVVETESSSGIFQNTDESDKANIRIATDAPRGTTATIDYNDSPTSLLVANFFGTINMDEAALGGEWNSGEEIPVLLTDQDVNLNSKIDEDITLSNSRFPLIPSLRIGSPITLAGLGGATGNVVVGNDPNLQLNASGTVTVDAFSDRANLGIGGNTGIDAGDGLEFTTGNTVSTVSNFLDNGTAVSSKYSYLNYDLRAFQGLVTGPLVFSMRDAISGVGANEINATAGTGNGANSVPVAPEFAAGTTKFNGLIDLTNIDMVNLAGANSLTVVVNFTGGGAIPAGNYTVVVDFFNFGQDGDGNLVSERFNNAIYRLELEETGDNTGQFAGTVEYIMLNQLNVNQTSTYKSITPVSDEIVIIVHEDLTDEDSPRINYLDKGADGVSTQIADQKEAPTHYGVNSAGEAFGRLLDITFDDSKWQNFVTLPTAPLPSCAAQIGAGDDGLGEAGFSLIETGPATGIFKGDFQIPTLYFTGATTTASTTGVDMEVNYVDFRDASGEIIEVGDGAGIRANTGSVSLDRTAYPVPWGQISDIALGTTGGIGSGAFSIFPIHATGVSINADESGGADGIDTDNDGNNDDPTRVDATTDTVGSGDVVVHVRVNDPDFDISASGEDIIALADATNVPPVKLTISRGQAKVTLGFAGGVTACDFAAGCEIDIVGTDTDVDDAAGVHAVTGTLLPAATDANIILFGPIKEIAPDAGIFESDITVRYFDGPAGANCPTTTGAATLLRTEGALLAPFFGPATSCIQQGDILTVEYTDPTDASGDPNTVTDSATFDLRNGVLQSDKSVYIIGADMILTIIEPDWDRDNDGAETYDLDVIEWDSDAATVTMGDLGGQLVKFDPEPSAFRETGDSTGIFQVVIEIPDTLGTDKLERGEEVILEYTDWGPSGADFVGNEDEDINLTIFTSNFGATVELDQKVYTWTDKVYLTIVAPDHNFDSNLIDEIGESATDPIKVATRGNDIDNYKLVETGTDTGIFTGEVILTGFTPFDSNGDGTTNDVTGITSADGTGPTDGFLDADH